MNKEKIPYYFNPVYDFILIVVGSKIPSKRSSYSINQNGDKILKPYRGQQFEKALQEGIKSIPNQNMPFEGRLLLYLQISMKSKSYREQDLDNVTKTILDSLKGVVFKDDSQIDALVANKSISNSPAFTIGIIKLKGNESMVNLPKILSKKPFDKLRENTLILSQNEE